MSEIEVPYHLYDQYCSRCTYKEEWDKTTDDVIDQISLLPDERGNVRVRCSKDVPCTERGIWEAEVGRTTITVNK